MRRNRSQDPERVQLADRLEERAAADRMEKMLAYARELVRACGAAVPAEGIGVERKRARSSSKRVLLVAEHGGREQVEEAVLPGLCRIGVMQPGRRLEAHAALAAAPHECGQILHGRDRRSAAADLRDSFDIDAVALPFGAAVDDRELTAFDLRPLGHDEAAEEPRIRAR